MSSTSSTTTTATPPRQPFEQTVDEVKVSKSDLNKVVMDYLISEGYPLAAQYFASEADVKPKPDVYVIQERVEIRNAIYTGNIQTAIEKINELDPQILDTDLGLHFALLRLQLIELIRNASATDNADMEPAIKFATEHLAPRAPTNEEFLEDLERTMALLIFPLNSLAPPLAALLDPSLRQDVARKVNEALLKSQGERAKATLYDLVNHRSWAQQKAVQMKKDAVPEDIDVGLDPIQSGSPHNDSLPFNASHTEGMLTEWNES